MKASLLTASLFFSVALVACNQSTTPTTSGSPAGSAAVASSRASASGAASASAGTSAKQIDLKVIVPEDSAKAGVEGMGWTVDVIAKGQGPAMDRIKPSFRQSTNSGKNAAFPGLVVLITSPNSTSGTTSSTGASASPGTRGQPNLAGFFQIIGLPNTLGGVANVSSVSTSASSSPAARASASASPAGTAATRTTTATDNETAEATWFVQQSLWGTDVDVEMTVFVVDGDAPDLVTDKSQLKIVSNEVTVRFHINGSGTSPSGGNATAAPSASAAPSTSAAPSGSARPSPSASSTP